jgi:hypothetical protein
MLLYHLKCYLDIRVGHSVLTWTNGLIRGKIISDDVEHFDPGGFFSDFIK